MIASLSFPSPPHLLHRCANSPFYVTVGVVCRESGGLLLSRQFPFFLPSCLVPVSCVSSSSSSSSSLLLIFFSSSLARFSLITILLIVTSLAFGYWSSVSTADSYIWVFGAPLLDFLRLRQLPQLLTNGISVPRSLRCGLRSVACAVCHCHRLELLSTFSEHLRTPLALCPIVSPCSGSLCTPACADRHSCTQLEQLSWSIASLTTHRVSATPHLALSNPEAEHSNQITSTPHPSYTTQRSYDF